MATSSAAESEPIRAASSATSPSGSIWVPLLVALAVLLGSLWSSMGMGLKACPLCFYQRTFVMGVVAVLGMGVVDGRAHRGVLTVAALPLAVAGVAAFHEYLEQAGKLECPGGVMGVGTPAKYRRAGRAARCSRRSRVARREQWEVLLAGPRRGRRAGRGASLHCAPRDRRGRKLLSIARFSVGCVRRAVSVYLRIHRRPDWRNLRTNKQFH